MRAKYDVNDNFVLSLRDKSKNEIDAELSSLYETKLEDIASRYEFGGGEWLEENLPQLYGDIQSAEDELNLVWDRTLEGRSIVDNFKAALCQWHEIQMKGIKDYKGAVNN